MGLIKSGKVKVFPTAWRKPGENSESSLNTEENITMLSRRISQGNSYDSYVINYDNAVDGTLTFVIHGYWFKITDVNSVYTDGQPLYVKIKLVSDSSSDFVNMALGKADDATATRAAILDDENGDFHGLEFFTSDPSVTTDEYKLYLLDSTKNIPAESRLNISTDQIQNGAGSKKPISEEFTTEHIYTPYLDATPSSITAETLYMQTHASNYYGVAVASGEAYFTLESTGLFSVGASNLRLYVDDTTLYGRTVGVYTVDANIYFDARSGQAGMRLTSTGEAAIYASSSITLDTSEIRLSGSTITNSLYPYATNTYNLGSSTKVYKTAYISNIYGSSASVVNLNASTAYAHDLYTDRLGYQFSGYTYAVTTLGSIYSKTAVVTYNQTSSVGIGIGTASADIDFLAIGGGISMGAFGEGNPDANVNIYADNTVDVYANDIIATANNNLSLFGKSGVYFGGYKVSNHYAAGIYAGTYPSGGQNIAYIDINADSSESGVIRMLAFGISASAKKYLYAATSSSAIMYAKDIYASASNNISFYASNSLAVSASSLAFNGSTEIDLDAGSKVFMQAGDHGYNVAAAAFSAGYIDLYAYASQNGITVGHVMAYAPDIYLNYGNQTTNGIHFGKYSAPQTIVKREDTYSDSDNVVTLPIKSGNLVVRESANTGVGSYSRPVYVDGNGIIKEATGIRSGYSSIVYASNAWTKLEWRVGTPDVNVGQWDNPGWHGLWLSAIYATYILVGDILHLHITVKRWIDDPNKPSGDYFTGDEIQRLNIRGIVEALTPITPGSYLTLSENCGCTVSPLRRSTAGYGIRLASWTQGDYLYIIIDDNGSGAGESVVEGLDISLDLKVF